MSGVEVRLNSEELLIAALGGAAGQAFARLRGQKDRYGFKGDSWGVHIEGIAAEMAVAKALGKFYMPGMHRQRSGEADVGPYQVRSSQRLDAPLILHPADADDAIFILAVGTAPEFRVVGWLRAFDGKQPGYWRETDRPAYFVPQDALVEMPSLLGVR